jgi:hypothetical protein
LIKTILAAGVFSCCMSCNAGKLVKTESIGADTTLLSRTDKPVIIGNVPAPLAFTFSENSKELFDSNYNTWLLLDDPQIIAAPDGVYEIYLTSQPPAISKLTATNPAFVNVLDLYSITAPGAKQIIEVDIKNHVKNIFLQKQPMQPVYITMVFSGNQLADGSKSKKAGELRFSGIRIVQTKE